MHSIVKSPPALCTILWKSMLFRSVWTSLLIISRDVLFSGFRKKNEHPSPVRPFHDAPDLTNVSHISPRNRFTDWKTQINSVIPHIEVVPFEHPVSFSVHLRAYFILFKTRRPFNTQQTLDLYIVIVMPFVFFPFILTPNIQPASLHSFLTFFLHTTALLLSFLFIEHKAHILVELSIIIPKPFSSVAVTTSVPIAVYINFALFFPTCINLHLSKLNIISHFNEPYHSVLWGPPSTLRSNLVFFPPGVCLVLSAKLATFPSTFFSR